MIIAILVNVRQYLA